MSAEFVAALDATVRVAAVGAALTGAELAADRQAFVSGGPFSAGVVRVLRGSAGGSPASPAVVAAAGWGLAAAAVMLAVVGPASLLGVWLLAATLSASIYLRWRRAMGGDGAEQLTIITMVAALPAFAPAVSPERAFLGAAFIAGQVCLAYFTAGVAKLSSPIWRDGGALASILATSSHGHPWAARLLKSQPGIGRIMEWSIMLFEAAFPFLLLAPDKVAFTAAALGASFHIGCAVLMGLNCFPWAFLATYICIFTVRAHLLG